MKWVVGVMFAVAALSAGPARALIVPGAETLPAVAEWQSIVDYCEEHPCGEDTFEVLPYTESLAALLRSVNLRVNREIAYRNDSRPEVAFMPTYGDCDDYAFTKQSILIEHGVPAGAVGVMMNYWTRAPEIGMHATTAVATDRGTVLLSDGIDEPILVDTRPGEPFVHERYGPMLFVGYIAGNRWFTPQEAAGL